MFNLGRGTAPQSYKQTHFKLVRQTSFLFKKSFEKGLEVEKILLVIHPHIFTELPLWATYYIKDPVANRAYIVPALVEFLILVWKGGKQYTNRNINI